RLRQPAVDAGGRGVGDGPRRVPPPRGPRRGRGARRDLGTGHPAGVDTAADARAGVSRAGAAAMTALAPLARATARQATSSLVAALLGPDAARRGRTLTP